MAISGKAPVGIQLLNASDCCRSSGYKDLGYRAFILIATFFCYTAYHLSRKPISVVKPQLRPKCNTSEPDCEDGWAPFDGEGGQELLGTLDYAYLFSYAISMFFSGHVAERMDLRYFLSLGMLMSGLFTAAFGFGYYLNIHNFAFFISIQIVGGMFQSTGWPAVVAVMGNWFGKGKRGFIFGVWNAHTSVGNILGSVIAAAFVTSNWGLSFIVPGIIISSVGFFVFMFLVPKPDHVGCSPPDHHGTGIVATRSVIVGQAEPPSLQPPPLLSAPGGEESMGVQAADDADGTQSPVGGRDSSGGQDSDSGRGEDDGSEGEVDEECWINCFQDSEEVPLMKSKEASQSRRTEEEEAKAVTIWAALKIPGVVEFSLCLLFAKLVSYTFLYWLPTFIQTQNGMDPEQSGYLSTLFDVGGILGGILAGTASDYTRASGCTCVVMLLIGAPLLFMYYTLAASSSIGANIGMLMLIGVLVNGPYALITTAVSADLGTHPTLQGSGKALATVTAIIDGTGSIGAAIGPLIAGVIPTARWNILFIFLMACDFSAALLLTRVTLREIKIWRNRRQSGARYREV